MSYQMVLDEHCYHMQGTSVAGYSERRDHLRDEEGFAISLNNIFTPNAHLKWGYYTVSTPKAYTVIPDQSSLVLHFCLAGGCTTEGSSWLTVQDQEILFFYERAHAYHHALTGGPSREGAFFELLLAPTFFERFYAEDNAYIKTFIERHYAGGNGQESYSCGRIATQTLSVIQAMKGSPYTGHLQALYLESKIVELLLMQLQAFHPVPACHSLVSQSQDIDRLHAVKAYIAQHYDSPLSIMALAREAGINQTKLKQGFKTLFGTTVFGYVNQLRMEAARHLLQDGRLPVADVAYRIGYKHPQHFAVAFRKYFGHAPGKLKVTSR